MTAGRITITRVTVTPVAFADPPLLTAAGVHEPFALRAIIEVVTDAGLTGLGETYADEEHLAALNAAAAAIQGADVYDTNEIYRRVRALAPPAATIASGLAGDTDAVDRVFSPFEVACLDIQGKAAGRPVADLLGGAVRAQVPFSAYLFYKWAGHPGADRRRLGRGGRSRWHRGPGQEDGGHVRLHRDQAQGRRVPAGAGDRGGPGAARGLPRPPAAARPERRVDARHVDRRRPGPGRHAGVPGGPDTGHRRHGGGGAARVNAAGHQHVRGRLRSP